MALDELRPGQSAPKTYYIPDEDLSLDFRIYMGWTDIEVFNRQPDGDVFRYFVRYKIRRQFGRL